MLEAPGACPAQELVDGGLDRTVGDSYDNAMAEAVNGLYKAEPTLMSSSSPN